MCCRPVLCARSLLSLIGLAGVLAFSAAGCRREGAAPGGRTPPNPGAPALYGPARGVASTSIPVATPGDVGVGGKPGSVSVLQTELSPALLVRCATRHLDLFAGSSRSGLGAPGFVAWTTQNGPRNFKRGETLDVSVMRENWVLVWWAGAEGWTNWDSPWVIYLQHKPDAMSLDREGLHLDFPGDGGDIVLLPLYGYDKLPGKGSDLAAEHGLAGRKLKTWEWPKVLPRDPLTRIRYWAAVTREIPIRCEDTFSVDRSRDQVTMRSRFDWHSITDDWRTRHLKVAPLSPPLGLVLKDGGFPAALGGRWFDLEFGTPYGPYLGVEGVDGFEVNFPVLHYINETEAFEAPPTNAHPSVAVALDRLRRVMARQFPEAGESPREAGASVGFPEEFSAAGWLARALPYCDEPTRARAAAALRRQWTEHVLVTNRFILWEEPVGSGRCYRILSGPGLGTSNGGTSATAASAAATLLDGIWAYAHFTGDWDLVRERWPLLRSAFVTATGTRWAGFGRDGGGGSLGEDAGACVAYARLAYQAGDMDAYNYGGYLLARALVQMFVRQRGTDYFRSHQPWHSMEWMGEEVFPGALGAGTTGWQLDGPGYPEQAGSRQFERRWAGFKDPDLARFYRDHLAQDVRRELNWLQHRAEPAGSRTRDTPQVPSLVLLRSYLLQESPAELSQAATVDGLAGPAAGVIASCLAVLRASHPARYTRLIPAGEPTPFVAGTEREGGGANPELVISLEQARGSGSGLEGVAGWPELTWENWRAPNGGRWTFGEIRASQGALPARVQATRLNWNTRMISYSQP